MFNVIGKEELQHSHPIPGSPSNGRIILPLAAVVFFAASSVFSQPKNVVVPRPDLTKLVLKSFTITPASVQNGGHATGIVTLNAPAPANTSVSVSLTQLSPGFAGVPPAIVVLAGQSSATLDMVTSLVTAPTNSSVSASCGGITRTATLTVLPTKINSLTLTPNRLVGGGTTSAVVKLSDDVPAGAVIQLSSSNPALASAQGGVGVNNSDHTGFVILNTAAVTAKKAVEISATYAGSTKHTVLILDPPH